MSVRQMLLPSLLIVVWHSPKLPGAEPALSIETPMSPPAWALLERELIEANTAACEEFFAKYFDERGYLVTLPLKASAAIKRCVSNHPEFSVVANTARTLFPGRDARESSSSEITASTQFI